MIVVLDTCVLVSAVKSASGASRYLLTCALQGTLATVISTALLYEYEEVLLRPENLSPQITCEDVASIIDGLAEVSIPAKISYLHRPSILDAADEFVFEAAYSVGAAIVTHNKKDFSGCERFGVQLLTPKEAIELLGL